MRVRAAPIKRIPSKQFTLSKPGDRRAGISRQARKRIAHGFLQEPDGFGPYLSPEASLFSRPLLASLLACVLVRCSAVQSDCAAFDASCDPLGNVLYFNPICAVYYSEVSHPSRWSQVQAEMQRQAIKGNYGAPSAATFGTAPGTAAYVGGVLAPNGKIYAIPHNATVFAVIDPNTNTVSTFGTAPGSTAWAGGVLAPNGRIYGIPFSSTTVVEIDPVTNTTVTFGALSAAGNKWSGGVLASDGLIYAFPTNESTILVINPETRSVSTTGSLTGYGSAVLAPQGRIYGIAATAPAYAAFDPFSSTTSTFGTAGGNAFLGAALAPNGSIYALPFTSATYAEIDPALNSVSTFGAAPGGSDWTSGVLAPDGKIYGIPGNATTYNYIDPDTRVATTFGAAPGPADRWQSGILAPNGKIYGIPYNSLTYLEIDPRANGSFCGALLQSAYLNKF